MIFVDIAIFSAFPNVQLLDCAITRYYYPVVSHFIKALATSNQTISPGQILLHFPLIIILELNPCSENSLRRVQNLSQPKFVITTAERFKDFLACRIAVSSKHQYPVNIQRLFGLQSCLSRKSSISRKYSKILPPAEMPQQQIINIPEIFKDFSRLQSCLSRKSSISRKNSKIFLPAELSLPQIINIPEIFKDLLACRIVLAPSHQYPENIRILFRLQSCLNRKSSISRKYPKNFSPAELSQPQIIGFPKYSKTFSPAELSQPKIINIRELFKNFFCLQNCRSRKSPISRKDSKAFSPAEQYQEQVIKIPEIFTDFFACRNVSSANHQYPEKTQRLIGLQSCLSRKSSISGNYSKTILPVELA